jgi:hypothetical protein
MVSIVVNTPLHVNHVTTCVGNNRRRAPTRAGLIVIDAHASVVAARTAASNLGRVEIRPCRDGLEDGALREAKRAIQEFENTATGTFSKQRSTLSTIINDGKYDPSAIEKAFEKACSTPMRMFNPLRTESKVAVTTTEVKRSLARLIANYNGGKRPPTLGMYPEIFG